MVLLKLKLGVETAYSVLVSIGVLFWTIFYLLFVFIIPFKWRIWRTSSKFKKSLINKGIPLETADQIADSHYKQVSFISLWRWWRALDRKGKENLRGKTETPYKAS